VQLAARRVGLEVNCKPTKTEYVCIGVPELPIVSVDGVAITRKDAYTYLGTMPFDYEAHFNNRVSKAWGAIHALRVLWKSSGVSGNMKVQMLATMVTTVFSYGASILPMTVSWTTRIDAAFTSMMRFCLNDRVSDEFQLYENGRIPRLSSLLARQRFATLGHAIRHHEMLGLIATQNYTSRKRRGGQHHTIDFEYERVLGPHRDEWDVLASDRIWWASMCTTTTTTSGCQMMTYSVFAYSVLYLPKYTSLTRRCRCLHDVGQEMLNR
jgi:hypothetical protein